MICVRSGVCAELAAVLFDEHFGADVSPKLDRLQLQLLCCHRHSRTHSLTSYFLSRVTSRFCNIMHSRFTLQSTKVLNSLNISLSTLDFNEHKSDIGAIILWSTLSVFHNRERDGKTKRISAVEITNIWWRNSSATMYSVYTVLCTSTCTILLQLFS